MSPVADEPRFEDLVRVMTAPTIPEGLLARGLLQADGIPVIVKGEAEGPYRVGPMELWVPRAFEVQARMLLEDAARGDEGTEVP